MGRSDRSARRDSEAKWGVEAERRPRYTTITSTTSFTDPPAGNLRLQHIDSEKRLRFRGTTVARRTTKDYADEETT